MAIAPLPLAAGAAARALPRTAISWAGDAMDRTIIQLSVEDWLLEKLMAFRADAAEFEDGGDAEPEPDDEEDGPPFVVDLVRGR